MRAKYVCAAYSDDRLIDEALKEAIFDVVVTIEYERTSC